MHRSLLTQFCPACRASPLSPSAGNELRLGTELQAPGRAESWLRTVLLHPCRTLSSDHSLPAKVSECLRHSMLWPAPAHSHHSFYTFSRGLNLNTQWRMLKIHQIPEQVLLEHLSQRALEMALGCCWWCFEMELICCKDCQTFLITRHKYQLSSFFCYRFNRPSVSGPKEKA